MILWASASVGFTYGYSRWLPFGQRHNEAPDVARILTPMSGVLKLDYWAMSLTQVLQPMVFLNRRTLASCRRVVQQLPMSRNYLPRRALKAVAALAGRRRTGTRTDPRLQRP